MARKINELAVWITGGGTGIGRAMALEFASRGCSVAVSGRREECLGEVVAQIQAQNGTALGLTCDVTKEEEVQVAVDAVAREFGKLDIAVANAGFGVGGKFQEISTKQWRSQMDINVIGVATTLRLALPKLEQVGGRAAVVSSVMGKFALAGSSPYCASKHALMGMCNCLRQELVGSGVSLTNLLPGLVDSDIFKIDNDGVKHEDWEDRRPTKLCWPADRAAKVMVDAIANRKSEFTFTGHGKLLGFVGQHMPNTLYWAMGRGGVKNVR